MLRTGFLEANARLVAPEQTFRNMKCLCNVSQGIESTIEAIEAFIDVDVGK